MGQVVSEIGDSFNNIAVVSLAVDPTASRLIISWLMISRALPMMLAGPLAGVALDRYDRKRLMISSDILRAVFVLGFLLYKGPGDAWALYVFSGLTMFASPFFTSGRRSILPALVKSEDLHTANALTQTTQWATTIVGSLLAGVVISRFGHSAAFVGNSLSFLVSALAVFGLQAPAGAFTAVRASEQGDKVRPWHEYVEGLRYMRSVPVVTAIALGGVGWAVGGGAAQVLFGIFGEQVFKRGASGIGTIWGFAGIGLLMGASVGHEIGKELTYSRYKKAVSAGYFFGGVSYVVFSQMEIFPLALLTIMVSRLAFSLCGVLNVSRLLHTVPDQFRGRVFATLETLTWTTMMISMMGAGVGLLYLTPQTVGTVAGALTASTGLLWAWADKAGKLPEPAEHESAARQEVKTLC